MNAFKKSVMKRGMKLYNKLPTQIRKLKKTQHFERELRPFLLLHTLYSVDAYMSY
jgi:hypothetical protein